MANKTEFIKELSEKLGTTQKEAETFVKVFFETIKEATLRDGEVKFIGTGTFKKKFTPEHEGKNPKTNEPLMIKESTSIKFSSGTGFKKL